MLATYFPAPIKVSDAHMDVCCPVAGLVAVQGAESTGGMVEGGGNGRVTGVESRVEDVRKPRRISVVDWPQRGDDVAVARKLAGSGEMGRFIGQGDTGAGGGAERRGRPVRPLQGEFG